MNQEYSAGIVVFNKSKEGVKYLILQYQAGHWDLPKGHIEGQETKEITAIRETKEETNLDVEIIPGFEEGISYNFRNPEKDMVKKDVFFFVGESHSTNVQVSFEHKGFKWLSYDDAINQLTFKSAKRVLEKVKNFIDSKKYILNRINGTIVSL